MHPSPSRPTARLRRRALTLAITTAVLAASCSSGADGEMVEAQPPETTPVTAPQPSPGCDTDPATAGPRGTPERVDLTSDGADRWYAQLVPTAYDGAPTALVVDLHGYLSGSAGQVAMSDLGSVAEEAGFVVATPQGTSEMPYWNAVPHAELPDDIGFVEDVIDDVGTNLCIDADRVYVDGFSNGAFLASLVACRLSDRVAAVAAVAGLVYPSDCSPTRPVPVLAIHGTDDQYVSFTGGPGPALDELTWNDQSRLAFDGLPFASVSSAAAEWAELHGCGPDPARTDVGTDVELVEYSGCAEGSTVRLYVVDGGGHTWPGSTFSRASEPILGPTTEEIDASEVIWSFFGDHPMP